MCDPTPQDYFGDGRFDDPAIGDDDRLIRHCRTPVQIVPCPVNGQKISDQAFKGKKTEAGISVDLECLLTEAGLTAQSRMGALPNTYAMVAITAKTARANSAGVAWTPKPAENRDDLAAVANPYHGEVIMPVTNGQARSMYRASTVVHTSFQKVA